MCILKMKANYVQAASLLTWMTFVMDPLRNATQDCIPSHGAWWKTSQEKGPRIVLGKKRTLANLGKTGILVPAQELKIL
jgi:hypothetical protein